MLWDTCSLVFINRIFVYEQVVLLVLEVQACIARDTQHFRHLMVFLLHKFNNEQALLEKYVL